MAESFIQKYVDYASQVTDAPLEYHEFVALSIMSAAIKNNLYFKFGDLDIYPNLWMILLAPSSNYRKSTSIGIGIRILNALDETLIYPNEFSHEKLVEVLQYQPQGLFVFYEFLTLMGLLSKDYMAGVKSFLTELYDSPPYYSRKTRNTDLRINNPCISILGATTLEWFLECSKEGDLAGGFLPRFLFVPVSVPKLKTYALPPPADQIKKNALVFLLKQISSIKGEIRLSDEAKKEYEGWYRKFEHSCNGDTFFGAFYTRLQIYAIKFAMLEELSANQSIIISPESMKRATIRINWLKAQLNKLAEEEFAFTGFQKMRKKVVKILQSCPEGISRTELYRKAKLSAKQLKEVLSTLENEENLEWDEKRKEGSDKPVTYLKLKTVV